MLGFTVHLTYPGSLARAPSLVLCPHFIDEDTKAQKVGLVVVLVLRDINWDLHQAFMTSKPLFSSNVLSEQLVNLVKLPVETWDVYSH